MVCRVCGFVIWFCGWARSGNRTTRKHQQCQTTNTSMASRTHQEDGDDNPYDKYKNQKEEYRSWFHSHYTFAISLILIAAAHYCYFQSLEGGNDVQVKSRLLHIGLNLLGSCVFFLAGLYLFVVKVGIARPIKGLILTIIALSMGWVLTYDLGKCHTHTPHAHTNHTPTTNTAHSSICAVSFTIAVDRSCA